MYRHFYRPNKLLVYNQWTVYDVLGRVLNQYDASGQGVTNFYRNGYLYQQVEAETNQVLNQIISMNAQGQITSRRDGLNINTLSDYDFANGQLKSIISGNGGQVQNIEYTYDGLGNLLSRNNISSGINQTFEYDDDLNRLETVTGFKPQTISYDDNGNILTKSDVKGGAQYQYGSDTQGPHAVESIDTLSYEYDANGNQTLATDSNNGYRRHIHYSYFDKPTLMQMGDNPNDDRTSFAYDSNRKRYQRIDVVTNDNTKIQEQTITYYVGNVEISQSHQGVISVKRYVANAIQITRSNNTSSTRYTYQDHLGSLDAVLTETGKIESKLYFDAWGKRTVLSKSQLSIASQAIALVTLIDATQTTHRGFTGHESIDHTGIIHMNGRIYDPTLGRFLQADPFIQAPKNSQSYNRYSYGMNNPLSGVDPSGYIFGF